jgi:hypothetical protein
MSPATKLLFMLALGLALAATALADDYNKKHEGGPCKGGYWPDGKGCCPEMIKGRAYYRDGNKCYPKDLGCGVYYADGRGYASPHRTHRTHTARTPCEHIVS